MSEPDFARIDYIELAGDHGLGADATAVAEQSAARDRDRAREKKPSGGGPDVIQYRKPVPGTADPNGAQA